jgi:hypothetical protein
MYNEGGAAWEISKNGFDSIWRLMKRLGPKFKGVVEIMLLDNHPLSSTGKTMIFLDNGEGLTEPSKKRFLSLGPETRERISQGRFDQKRIGRIAALRLLNDQSQGFFFLTSTSSTGDVQMLHVTPAGLSKQEVYETTIPRDDVQTAGLCPDSSFAMVVLPNVIKKVQDLTALREELKWFIPRDNKGPNFELRIGGKTLVAPPIPDTVSVCEEGIEGFFAKDASAGSMGIRLCDAESRTMVARAIRMPDKVPYPFGRPEINGDVFIPGLLANQDAARAGLSPDFLGSDTWLDIQRILLDHFSAKLRVLLGDEGTFGKTPARQALKSVLEGIFQTWGSPDKEVEAPAGMAPVEDGLPGDDEDPFSEDEGEGGNGGPDDGDKDPTTRRKRGDGTKKPRKKRSDAGKPRPHRRMYKFCYKGKTYVVGTRPLSLDVTATFDEPNLIWLNMDDPVATQWRKRAPAALRDHLFRALIGAIERSRPDHQFNPDLAERAINLSMQEFLSKTKS